MSPLEVETRIRLFLARLGVVCVVPQPWAHKALEAFFSRAGNSTKRCAQKSMLHVTHRTRVHQVAELVVRYEKTPGSSETHLKRFRTFPVAFPVEISFGNIRWLCTVEAFCVD